MITMLSATYANADHSSAVVLTVERGHKAVSRDDTPMLWDQLMQSGLDIAPCIIPDVVTRTPDQLLADMARASGATDQEFSSLIMVLRLAQGGTK